MLDLVRREEAEPEMRRVGGLPFSSPAMAVVGEAPSTLVMDGDVAL